MTLSRNLSLATLTAIIALGPADGVLADPLVVYSPQGGERAEWIVEQGAAAGHDIDILNAGGGELFDRLLAEKNNPQADVVFGLVDASMALLKAEGLFQPHVPSWGSELPDAYKGTDGMIHKFWQTPIVLAYNADELAETDAPKGWLDLTQPRYKGKYVIGASTWQTTRTFLAGILARFLDENGEVTDEGWDFMRNFFANGIVVNDVDSKNAAFKSGEAVIDLNWFGGVYRQSDAMGYTPGIVDTEGGTPFIAEGIAIVAGTDQLEDAKAFVDWFGSPEFMASYAARFKQVPVHPDAIAMSPDSVQADAVAVRPQDIDWDGIAPKLDGWLQKIELEIR